VVARNARGGLLLRFVAVVLLAQDNGFGVGLRELKKIDLKVLKEEQHL
jgi:hypothetical protein